MPEESAPFGRPEALLQAIADALPVVIAYVDANGRFAFGNRYYEQRYGRGRGGLVGRHARDVLGEESFRRLEPYMRRALAGETVSFETEVERPGETPLWVSATYVPDVGPDGRVRGFSAVSSDISARRAAEQKLFESERQLRILADVIPQMVWVTGPDGRVEYINARWYEYTGIPAGERSIESWHAVVHPDDMAAVSAAQARALAGREPLQVEYRIRRRDGAYRWHLARTVFIEDTTGRAVKRFGTATDIHEQKVGAGRERLLARAVASLNESAEPQGRAERAARIAVELLGGWCAVYLLDAAGTPTLTGSAHSDPALAPLIPAMHARFPLPDDATRGARAVARTGQPEFLGEVPEERVRAGVRDPAHAEMLLRLGMRAYACVPLRTGGAPFGAMTVASAGALERADLVALDEFARSVSWAIENARTVAELRAAQAGLEEAVRARDEFLATLSHELRTPLNAIAGYVSMLRQGVLPPARVAHALEVIDRNARAQTRLIEDLLDASRIVGGKMRLDLRPTVPAQVAGAALDAVRPAAAAKGIALDVSLGGAGEPMMADPDRLQQVVWNLLSNAIKFTPPGGTVRLALEERDDRVELTVEDNGPGIPAEFLPHVFERFRQADAARARGGGGGLGLGLSIVRHLVELHGGTVRAENPEQGGARFRVELPRVAVGER